MCAGPKNPAKPTHVISFFKGVVFHTFELLPHLPGHVFCSIRDKQSKRIFHVAPQCLRIICDDWPTPVLISNRVKIYDEIRNIYNSILCWVSAWVLIDRLRVIRLFSGSDYVLRIYTRKYIVYSL